MADLELVNIDLAVARRFVAEQHRHNKPPVGWKWGVGLARDHQLVGVAMAGRPCSHELQTADPRAFEITRVCTLGDKNANTRLYGAVCRAAGALGYLTAWTYTLLSESGASLKAAGFVVDAILDERESHASPSRPRYTTNLLGEDIRPSEPKIRWRRDLGSRARDRRTLASVPGAAGKDGNT